MIQVTIDGKQTEVAPGTTVLAAARKLGIEIPALCDSELVEAYGACRACSVEINDGRKSRPDLEVGICGEHGGDPASIEFCHLIGNNYVSCSPFRVPVARLAAASGGVGCWASAAGGSAAGAPPAPAPAPAATPRPATQPARGRPGHRRVGRAG